MYGMYSETLLQNITRWQYDGGNMLRGIFFSMCKSSHPLTLTAVSSGLLKTIDK